MCVSAQVVADKWAKLQALIPSREEQLASELKKQVCVLVVASSILTHTTAFPPTQESHEALRIQWAESAVKFNEWVAAQVCACVCIESFMHVFVFQPRH